MLGALLGAGISGAFGLIGQNKQNKANAKINAQNIALQKEFAQSGIQWRVADAKAAGIHPLAALGAQTHSFSPQSIGMDYSAMGRMGQDIGRAVQTATGRRSRQQMELYNSKVRELNLKNMELRNGLLASEIAKNNQAGQVPRTGVSSPMLVDGQPDAGPSSVPGLIIDMPQRRVVSDPSRKWQEPGAVSDLSYSRTRTGWAPVPSADIKRRIEDMHLSELAWAIRNQLAPSIGRNFNPPPVKLPRNRRWMYAPWYQEYQQWRSSGKKRPWHYMRR